MRIILSAKTAVLAALLVLFGASLSNAESNYPGVSLDQSADEKVIAQHRNSRIATYSTNDFNAGSSNGFFASLGTNSRTCETCHRAEDGWTFTPAHAASLARSNRADPLFAPVDGSDCPPASGDTADAKKSPMVVRYGLIREQIGIPTGADFSLTSATNPRKCSTPPGDLAIGGKLIMYRRPLPATNLVFLSTVRWDGRENVQPITTGPLLSELGPLTIDLGSQANHASQNHEQSGSIDGSQAQADAVNFEQNLYTAATGVAKIDLTTVGGGAEFIARNVAPNFFIGQNDPLGPNFSSTIFTLYRDWEPDENGRFSNGLTPLQKSIGRGERIFNTRTFSIVDVPGLNSAIGTALNNPEDPRANTPVTGTCGTCHNAFNVGNHSTSLPVNIGVTMATPTDNQGRPIRGVLDIRNLPVYTLRSSNGDSVRVTDPGRALISGNWVDIGKTKGPILRGLSARAPYFHNGSARDLRTVVRYYNARFQIGLKPREVTDLVSFLSAL